MGLPIIHKRCGKRIRDLREKVNPKTGRSIKHGDEVCRCSGDELHWESLCSSRQQPPNLDFYDKHDK